MVITHELTMDLHRRGVTPVVDAVQGDVYTREVKLTLTDNGAQFSPPAGVSASVAFRKPDGKKGWYDKLPDGTEATAISGNIVTAVLAPEMLTTYGQVDAAIVLRDADFNQLSTFGITVQVAKNPAAGINVSNNYYNYSTLEEINAAVDAALSSLQKEAENIAPPVVCEASGRMISVNDSSDRQPKSLALCGKTTQDVTPTPDAPVDLVTAGAGGTINVSVTGKNLFDYDTHAANGFQSTIPVVAGKTLYRNARASSPSAWTLYDTDGNSLGTFSTLGFTASNPLVLPANASYIVTTDSSSSVIYDMYVGYNSDTTYEPYACQTLTAQTPNGLPGIPTASGGNYTDENGKQWICDEIDFARGVRVQRIGVVDFATLTWKATAYKNDIQKGYYATISGIYDSRNTILHSHYFWDGWISGSEAATNVLGASQAAFNAREIGEIGFSGKGTGKNQIGVVVGINDGTPVGTLQYVLSEPIETPLTAEELAQGVALRNNKPNTTVYNDAGAGMKLSYVADTKAYIDKKFNELAAAIVNNA